MPPEQQRLLGQLYRISVQDPDMKIMNFNELKAAADLYQVRKVPCPYHCACFIISQRPGPALSTYEGKVGDHG